jgi:hypothetical protein
MRARLFLRHRCALTAILLTLAIAPSANAQSAAAGGDASDPWIDWTHWTPSVAVSGGFSGRDITSIVSGEVNGPLPGGGAGDVPYFSLVDEASSGAVVPIELRLLVPEFKKVPGEPRLYVNGGYVLIFKGSYLGGRYGIKSEFFSPVVSGVPQVRVENRMSETGRWFVGGGVQVKMPVDSYPTWLRLGVAYSEQDLTVSSSFVTGPSAENAFAVSMLTARDITPSIGLDVEVGRLSQTAVEVIFDVGVGIPLDDDVVIHDLQGFDPLFTNNSMLSYFEYGVSVSVTVGLRLSWVGP